METGDRPRWDWLRRTTRTHEKENHISEDRATAVAFASPGTWLAKQQRGCAGCVPKTNRVCPPAPQLVPPTPIAKTARSSPASACPRQKVVGARTRKNSAGAICHVPLRGSTTTAPLESLRLFPQRRLDVPTEVSRWRKQLGHGTASGLHRQSPGEVDTPSASEIFRTASGDKCDTTILLEGAGVDRRANNQNTLQGGPAQHVSWTL